MRLALAISTSASAALFLAGCSSGEPDTFKAEPTASCLRGYGYQVTTDDSKVGIVAANAPNGGLLAKEPGNALTIAFAQDSDAAIKTAAAIKRFAPKEPPSPHHRRHADPEERRSALDGHPAAG